MLYLEILQAIYGCIESALWWYKLYSETLCKEGFKINPYDKCVESKIINGKQCTVIWYVDDNKISHDEIGVIDGIIYKIEDIFLGLTVSK